MKNLHINGDVWTWMVGRNGTVVIRDPNRKKYVVGGHTIMGMDPYSFEKRIYKRCNGITPSDVKSYIEENFA